MSQLFRPRSNSIYRIILLFLALGSMGALLFSVAWKWSDYETERGVALMQPVPFSHKHHVGGVGLDCRYCHATVEKSATAGMPSSHTCMTCHSQIWFQAPMLEPVRNSYFEQTPLAWQKVNRLPQYVYFDHSIHVTKGIGCTSCHGDIARMALTSKARSFYMRDCLSCHRDPAAFLRPKNEVFNPYWTPPVDQRARGASLLRAYHIPKQRLTDCTTCHR